MTEVQSRLGRALGDRYHIERELGQGGMGLVFLATDLEPGRKVALKVLRPEIAQSLGAERFLREIRITAQLNHPNILTLIDSGEAERDVTGPPELTRDGRTVYFTRRVTEADIWLVTLP